jgi:hypothetical protein
MAGHGSLAELRECLHRGEAERPNGAAKHEYLRRLRALRIAVCHREKKNAAWRRHFTANLKWNLYLFGNRGVLRHPLCIAQ